MSNWIALFVLIAHAATPRSYDTIELKRTLEMGGSSRVKVELTDRGFQFNGIPLPPATIGAYARALHALRPQAGGDRRHPAARCAAGRGEITRTQGKFRTTETFCLEDKRGQEIGEALTLLARQAKLGASLLR